MGKSHWRNECSISRRAWWWRNGGGVGEEIGGGIGEGIGGRIGDVRVRGALNQSCNELGSRHLLGRWGFRDTSLAEGRIMEGL